ncbi:hypothetical protein Hanom_Chr08g00702751 [Helianthus anomalus]
MNNAYLHYIFYYISSKHHLVLYIDLVSVSSQTGQTRSTYRYLKDCLFLFYMYGDSIFCELLQYLDIL